MSQHLKQFSPELDSLLRRAGLPPPRFSVAQIRCETIWVSMRDGTRLATDVYLPPCLPAPVIVVRTPYDRSQDLHGFVGMLLAMARRGYVVVSQDCRGTGQSEPDEWDYYVFESEDSYDLIEWMTQQNWFEGFIGSCGISYDGQTQWCMATHPAMSTIAPGVSGLGVAVNTAHLHMNLNAYVRTVGHGADQVAVGSGDLEQALRPQLLTTGYFNQSMDLAIPTVLLERLPELLELPPQQARQSLWQHYCGLSCSGRANFIKETLGVRSVNALDVEHLPDLFGRQISHDAFTIPHTDHGALCRSIHAPALMLTGWYDWGLNDALATWAVLRREALEPVRERCRLVIGPHGHSKPGYREGCETHPDLLRVPTPADRAGLLLRWYEAIRAGTTDEWPTVIYYLMGAHEWRCASDWPIPDSRQIAFYLHADGALSSRAPTGASPPDGYMYDPYNPTPTVGGSVHSSLYPTGSVDVSGVQNRQDVVVYSTPVLTADLDLVGPLCLRLYASSSALDTDFVARVSDVFPDGRALQLQSGILRARFRDLTDGPQRLEPDAVYRLDIDVWATANRFKAGHRLRLDISSADFPRFDRNSNRGGEPGDPVCASQRIFHDAERPSHLLAFMIGESLPQC